jgi:FG-GAP-like repeat
MPPIRGKLREVCGSPCLAGKMEFVMNLSGSFCFRRVTSVVAALLYCPAICTPAWAQFETRAANPFPEGVYSIATGDFNNDGKLDVVMMVGGGFAVALGNGDGTLQKAVWYSTQLAYSLAAADFNGDGNLDIVVADENQNPSTVSVYLGNGDGTFKTPPITSNTTNYNEFIAVGDFNGDGKPDIVVIENPHVSVLLGKGDGTFGPPSDNDSFVGVHWLTVADFNNDHKLDVLATADFGSSYSIGVFLGNGDGTLQNSITTSTEFVPLSVAAGDLNGDGKMDAILGYDLGGIGVFLGNGDGTLQPPVIYDTTDVSGVDVQVADLNRDGKLDVAIEAGSGVDVFWGNGDGSLQPAQFFASGHGGYTIVGDLNNDHLPDFIAGTFYFGAVTMLNTGVVSFSPTAPLAFPAQLIDTSSTSQMVTLTNSGTAPLSISSIKASGPFKEKNTCGATLVAGTACTINAWFQPTTTGKLTGLITVVDSASSQPQFVELLGAGTGIKLSPGSLNFGKQKVGTTSASQVVTATNVGSIAVRFRSISFGVGDWTDFSQTNNCMSRALEPGASCAVSVAFDPAKTGVLTTQLNVKQQSQPGASPKPVTLTGAGD